MNQNAKENHQKYFKKRLQNYRYILPRFTLIDLKLGHNILKL